MCQMADLKCWEPSKQRPASPASVLKLMQRQRLPRAHRGVWLGIEARVLWRSSFAYYHSLARDAFELPPSLGINES